MAIKFTNNASATLAASITSTQTSVSLTTGQGALFPTLTAPDYFYVTFSDSANNLEIAKVTARTGDTLTVSRGQDGTVGQTFSAGDKCELRFTAAGITDLGAGLNITDLPANTTMAGVGIVTTTATQTLTNKTLTSPTVNSGTFSGGTFSGTPTVPTATAGTNNTQIASTAYVDSALAAYFPSGTKLLFQQTAAPTGWTKDTTHDNKALRVVNGAASSGGSVAFTSAFTSQSVGGTVGSTTLTTTEMPSHTHAAGATFSAAAQAKGGTNVRTIANTGNATGAAGGGGSHNHTFSGTAINLAVQYVDVIIATKN